jgi:polyphosphate kinase
VPGLSENIRVRSILGRFLEHSRVFRFGSGDARSPETEFWIGSADLMHRNLERRVEALVRVTDETARAELDGVLIASMADDSAAFDLRPDGTWLRRTSTLDAPLTHLQDALLRRALGNAA